MVTNPRGAVRSKPDPIALATQGRMTSEQLRVIVPLGDTEIVGILQEDFGTYAVHRQRTETLDAVHGSPTAVTYTDSAVTLVAQHLSTEELARDDSGRFKQGDKWGLLAASVSVLEGDQIIEKDQNATARAQTVASSTTVTIAADVRHEFATNDWLTTGDDENAGIYKVTGVAYSSPNTTLTVALDASLGVAGNVYKTGVYKVVGVQGWPNEVNPLFKALHLRPQGL